MKQYAIRARVTKSVHIIVEAETPEEAMERFEKRDWIEEQPDETLDWEATDAPVEES